MVLHGKKISKFDEDFMKNHNEDSNKGYILELDVEYPEHLYNLHGDLPFLAKRMKIKRSSKLVCNLYDKEDMLFTCSHKSSKTTIKPWTNTKKVHRVIKFNQKAWLK